MITFHAIYQGKHGDTAAYDEPKKAAYAYIAKFGPAIGKNYRLTCHADGCYTVAIDGLTTITFEQSH